MASRVSYSIITQWCDELLVKNYTTHNAPLVVELHQSHSSEAAEELRQFLDQEFNVVQIQCFMG